MTCTIQYKLLQEVNTDPQRRCYNGCHAKSELIWSSWVSIDWNIKPEAVDERLAFWKDLNAYAVSQRGIVNTKKEFQVIHGETT